MRKVIQVAAYHVSQPVESETLSSDVLVALCDDGTMWLRIDGEYVPSWVAIEDVPQPETPDAD